MRKLKFRIWNGSEMEYNVMAGFLGTFYVQGMDENDAASMSPFNTKYDSSIHTMQYTGFKDKRNQPIYDGDIVKSVLGDFIEIRKVVYNTGMGCWDFEFPNGSCRSMVTEELFWDEGECEIIGNIYKTPDLFK